MQLSDREEEKKLNLIRDIFQAGDEDKLRDHLQDTPVVEIADFVRELDLDDTVKVINMLDEEKKGWLFTEFDEDQLYELFVHIDKKEFAEIFSQMSSDTRADFYQYLDKDEQIILLPYLEKKIREDVISLSAYPPETAGGIMNTDFATVLISMSVKEAISKIRKDAPSKKMLYYVYVVDHHRRMLGFVTLKDLILADPEDTVKEVLHDNFIFARVDEDRESVAGKIEKYDLVAIPVLNPAEQLVGIVSHDDAIDVIRAEHTEDLEKFMGIIHTRDEVGYLDTNAFEHFKRRVVWVTGLAFVGIISGVILHSYEGALEQLMILALYLPMLADTGGNSGSQAATVVVRALALNQISVKNWFMILFKEAKIAILLALCLGALAYLKVLFLSWETDIPDGYNLYNIALIISLALSLQVITATVIGASLPMIVKRFGGDPAVAASPAITTVVDITGLLIYFTMATTFLL
ncbi:magnesium transporter [Cytophagaceae bacterium ABcell3]|nr:magnesium transporter [Cytophagaceae bacterium ABcell3]